MKLALLFFILTAAVFSAPLIDGDRQMYEFLNMKDNINGGCENGKIKWTASNPSTFVITTTASDVAEGKQACTFDSTSGSQYVETSQFTLPTYMKGQPCLLIVWLKGFDSNYGAKIIDNANNDLAVITLATYSSYTEKFIQFTPSSSATTVRFQIYSTANGAIGKFDKLWIGLDYTYTIADTDTIDLTMTSQQITGDVKKQMSIASDSSGIKLSGDSATPGNDKMYGTNGSGTKGWYAVPSSGMTNPMTASGDIIYGGTAGAPTALPKSTDGKFLTLSSGIPAWGDVSGSSGGGSSLEIIEQKSHLEKQSINYPISMTDFLGESFVETQNITITPRVSYASGTTLVADYNKTDIDLMNATTGWTAGTNTPTIAQDTTNKIEGTGSVKMTKASLNGSIDMYKTFTAFSLTGSLLSFSFYPDTITNVTRFYIKVESSASNDKTYYVPVANISAAAWNHISIDMDNDTADASTGTLAINSVTKIYFGYTTSSSQTVNVSVDFVVYQPNWILPMPASLYIWDGTNQERLAIASVAGTANYQRNTYTITALSNTYAVGAAYAKERNITIASNQGTFPSGLTGAVALTCYDQTVEHLPTSLSGKTLTMSQRFYDEQFKISTISSTTVTKVSSSTDKSGYFKSGDKVVMFHKKWNGRKYNSFYNSTVGANFKILTLTANATYASSEITLTHAGDVNSGADTSYWYIVRYSAEMLYSLEAETSAGALSTLTPTIFIPKGEAIEYFTGITQYWDFENASLSDKIGNYALAPIATNPVYGFDNNVGGYYAYSKPAAAQQYHRVYIASLDKGSSSTDSFTIEAWARVKILATGGVQTLFLNGTSGYTSSGWGGAEIGMRINGNNALLLFGEDPATYRAEGSVAGITDDNLFHYIVGVMNSFGSGRNRWELWIDGVKKTDYNAANAHGGADGYVSIGGNAYTGVNEQWAGDIGEVAIWGATAMTSAQIARRYALGRCLRYGGEGYIARGSVSSLTGSKLTLGTKLTRQDSTNQNPVIFQRSGILY